MRDATTHDWGDSWDSADVAALYELLDRTPAAVRSKLYRLRNP